MTTSNQPSSTTFSRVLHAAKLPAGFALLIAGGLLAIPGIPGPGIPILLLGLWMLSDHFTWAKRALAWVKERAAWLQRRANSSRSKRPVKCLSSSE
jgi:hypothetical protein